MLSLVPPSAAAQAPRPNIILVFTDDQRADTLWAMPNVQNALVDRGVSFSNAFVVNPVCCPSRVSTLTGGYSHSTGIYRNSPPYGGFRAFDDSSTIATWLKGAGYRTGYVGKYMNGYRGTPYVPPGWDHWVANESSYFGYTLNINGTLWSFGSNPQDYSTDVFAAEAVSFVEQTPGPFFLMFSPFAPHSPGTPAARHANAFADLAPWRPPSYDEEDIADKPEWMSVIPRIPDETKTALDNLRRDQLRSLLAVDEAVGNIVAALERTGRLENTMIVFTSDNGLLWGEHRLVNFKIVPWEESIRVPLVIRYDALIAQPGRESRMALNIDFAPTFAALAGASRPPTDGQSLVPLLSSTPTSWRSDFLIENVRHRAIWPSPTYCAVRSARYLYASYETGDEELYDLRADPYQMNNAAADPGYATILAARRARLEELCSPPPPIVCTTRGGPGSDSIVGLQGYDVICTFGGRDTVQARGGNDRVRSAEGADLVYGGSGHDRISSGSEGDRVSAGEGDDVIWAGHGDDVVWGGTGMDTIEGGQGNDRLIGGLGNDHLISGLGNDRLVGGLGNDRLEAGSGHDGIYSRDGYADIVTCGPGRDTAYVDGRDRVAGDCESVRRA
ncbi:MAG: sulfatase-like hydrolase/transferase [Actinomycetota bacterium]|nr:sulfatase-like hydrolase/transferase [Actinomycetota bacterium]